MASPGASLSPTDRRCFGLTRPVQTGGQVDAAGLDDARQRRRLATAPGHVAGLAGTLPPVYQGLRARRVAEPFAAAGRPVGLHDQGRGADGDQVVDGHGNRVLRDAVVVAGAGERGHFVGHQGLAAQALDDAGDVERADIDHVGRFAARGLDLAEPVAGQVLGSGRGGALSGDLQRVDQVVVDACLSIAQRPGVGVGGGDGHGRRLSWRGCLVELRHELCRARAQVSAAFVFRDGRPGRRGARADPWPRTTTPAPCLPVHRHARHRQDHGGAHPGQEPELHRA